MSTLRYSLPLLARFTTVAVLFAGPAYADHLVYVLLSQPCRLLDTRTSMGGPGPLTQVHGAYLFGAFDAHIQSAAQHGSSTGCGIPAGIEAVSVNMNMLNATAPGNISTWSGDAGTAAPNIGTAVYNPTVASPAAGQMQYNTGYTTISLGTSDTKKGRFYLQVANGQIDMTINLLGYWRPISWSEKTSSNLNAVALGLSTTSSGNASTAMGVNTTASGDVSTAIGENTTATGLVSTAIGFNTVATGFTSIAMGDHTTASGHHSTAIGQNVSTFGHIGSFIYGDASRSGEAVSGADNQFMVIADGGVNFYTSSNLSTGAGLAHGSGSWTVISDRNAKTAVHPVDPRDVLKKVAALPLNTWQYKAQESKYRHMGPMAQDFYAAFQLGESDKGIDTVDADGVALAAIQGLNALLAEKDAKTAAQFEEKDREMIFLREEKDREIAALRAELTTRVAALESVTADVAEMKAQFAAWRRLAPAPVTVALKP